MILLLKKILCIGVAFCRSLLDAGRVVIHFNEVVTTRSNIEAHVELIRECSPC
jgi:hypothetical protein